jgi:hypothetical protein
MTNRYILYFLFLIITFYSFTPGILFTIPAGSSKRVIALVHTLLWTVFITLCYYFFIYDLGLVVVPLFGIVFFIFSPDVLFRFPPSGSKEVVAGTHSLLFLAGSILFSKLVNRIPL